MIERPLSDKIQKIATSRIALFGLTAATMMITVSIVGAIQLQEASAAKPFFCYETTGGLSKCPIPNSAKACHEAQSRDPDATGNCRPARVA